jgi:hypothetical protein
MIEIKSRYTYDLDDKKEKIVRASTVCKQSGYEFEVWIFGQNGTMEQQIVF